MRLLQQRVRVAAGGDDQDGFLIFNEDFLVAVLVQLSLNHGDDAGKWFLEVGFGQVQSMFAPLFADTAEAEDWIVQRLQSLDL